VSRGGAGRAVSCGFFMLARERWHRRKHGYARRPVRRVRGCGHQLFGSAIISNTSGRALSSGSARSFSVCVPT